MDGVLANSPFSPFRRPYWRWLRAHWLREHSKRPRQSDDDWLRRAYRAVGHLRHDPRQLARLDPHVNRGLGVFERGDHVRGALEARLLSGATFNAVAEQSGLPVESVEAFHHLFFDVQPHLHAVDWIALSALGISYFRTPAKDDLSAVWKYFAFVGGIRAFEIVQAVTLNRDLPSWARGDTCADKRTRLVVKLTVAAMRSDSVAELLELARLFDDLQDMERGKNPWSMDRVVLDMVRPRKRRTDKVRSRSTSADMGKIVVDLTNTLVKQSLANHS